MRILKVVLKAIYVSMLVLIMAESFLFGCMRIHDGYLYSSAREYGRTPLRYRVLHGEYDAAKEYPETVLTPPDLQKVSEKYSLAYTIAVRSANTAFWESRSAIAKMVFQSIVTFWLAALLLSKVELKRGRRSSEADLEPNKPVLPTS